MGPVLLGTAVAQTVGANIIDLVAQGGLGFVLITLVSVGVVLLSWGLRIPTSMTLALVGAMVGWALASGAPNRIHWQGLSRVLVGMPVSVLAGGTLAWILYRLVRRLLGRLRHAAVLSLSRLQILAAVLQGFAYGSNDLEKTIGLVAVARALPEPQQGLGFSDALPLVASFASFAVGALVGGWPLARRVGFGVFKVRPMEALTEQLAAGSVVTALAWVGAPVSTTQTIDGALVGVGAGVRASAIRWGVMREMLASWLITLPLALVAAAVLHAFVLLLRVLV